MDEKVIISGAGGQGIMLLGKVLAEAAMRSGKYLTWLPSYGAEVRGGTAHCMVIISDAEIGSPHIDTADSLIIMNELSWDRFRKRLKKGGLAIVNSSLVKKELVSKADNPAQVLDFPFTDIAVKLGNIKVANMVALGFYLAKRKIIGAENVFRAMEKMAPADKKSLVEVNRQALSCGIKLIRQEK